MVTNFKITDIGGENISTAETNLLALCRRIWYANDLKFPDDFFDIICHALTTSSVPSFNPHFHSIYRQRCQAKALAHSQSVNHSTMAASTPASSYWKNDLQSASGLLAMASALYRNMVLDDKWSVKTKRGTPTAQPSAFVAQVPSKGPICWNCGGPHKLEDCPHPIDEVKVCCNKKLFYDNKRGRNRSSNSNTQILDLIAQRVNVLS